MVGMMKRRLLVVALLLLALLGGAGMLLFIPNPLGEQIITGAKAKGYLAYTPEEAVDLAYKRCSTCHSEQKILLYCARCGPPFIVVTHFMKKYVELMNQQGNGAGVEQFTDAELLAITQVWNGLIGNWESDWPRKDLKKLLGEDRALIRLLETPVAQRPIEAKLKDHSAPGSYKEETLQDPPTGAPTGPPTGIDRPAS
jgi:hypothetical protein